MNASTILGLLPQSRFYELGKVPATPQYPYGVVSLGSSRPGVRRTSGGSAGRVTTCSVQVHGRTADSVADYAARADAVLGDRSLDIAGRPYSRRDIEGAVRRDPDDDGVLTLTHVYTIA